MRSPWKGGGQSYLDVSFLSYPLQCHLGMQSCNSQLFSSLALHSYSVALSGPRTISEADVARLMATGPSLALVDEGIGPNVRAWLVCAWRLALRPCPSLSFNRSLHLRWRAVDGAQKPCVPVTYMWAVRLFERVF